MPYLITHLYDAPSTRSYRAVPVIIGNKGKYKLLGYKKIPNKGIFLLDDFEPFSITLPSPILVNFIPYRVGWIGEQFLSTAEQLGVIPEEFLEKDKNPDMWKVCSSKFKENRGWIRIIEWPEPIKSCETWLRRICLGVLKGEFGKDHAYLAKNCDPDHEYTRIAVWYSLQGDDYTRQTHLEWTVRLEFNKSRLPGDGSTEDLAKYYQERVQELLSEDSQ